LRQVVHDIKSDGSEGQKELQLLNGEIDVISKTGAEMAAAAQQASKLAITKTAKPVAAAKSAQT
jgi:hypothetical protein